jgi:hypothetical protein
MLKKIMIVTLLSLGIVFADTNEESQIVLSSIIKASDINEKLSELRSSIDSSGKFVGNASVLPFNSVEVGDEVSKLTILNELYKIQSVYTGNELSLSNEITSTELNQLFLSAITQVNNISETYISTFASEWVNDTCLPCDVICSREKPVTSCTLILGNTDQGIVSNNLCIPENGSFPSPAGSVDSSILNGTQEFSCLEGSDEQTLVATTCDSGYIENESVCELAPVPTIIAKNSCSLDYYSSNFTEFSEMFPSLVMNSVQELNDSPMKGIYIGGSEISFLKSDGQVSNLGGYSGVFQPQIDEHDFNNTTNKIESVYTNGRASAALLEDGRVKVWGNFDHGGDQTEVDTHNFNNTTNKIEKIYASRLSFLALLEDGRVKVWGKDTWGGDQSIVDSFNFGNFSNKIKEIFVGSSSYSVLLEDGTIRSWGDAYNSNQSVVNAHNFNNTTNKIKKVYHDKKSNLYVALLEDGRLKVWGYSYLVGQFFVDPINFNSTTNVVKDVFLGNRAVSVLLEDGRVKVWGENNFGGDQNEVDVHNFNNTTNVIKEIYSTPFVNLALLEDGRIKVWGFDSYGGDQSVVDSFLIGPELNTAKNIFVNEGAFFVLLDNGQLNTWGTSYHGGDQSVVNGFNFNNTTNVIKDIYPNGHTVAVILEDGRVKTWGVGSNQSQVDAHDFNDSTNIIKDFQYSDSKYVAIQENGDIKVWGSGINQSQFSALNLTGTSSLSYSGRSCEVLSCEEGFSPSSNKLSCEP